MSDFEPIPDKDNIWLRPRKQARANSNGDFPWGSWVCGILCAGLFLLILATGGEAAREGNDALAYATYPYAQDIWNGAYWGPLTSAFVHFDPFHLLFNLLWLRVLGPPMERHFGTLRFAILVCASAILSSNCQLAFSDSAAIGFSGVNYALFGFLWISRFRIPELHASVTDMVVKFMLAWLVIAPFISKAGLMPIGNAAHNSGILFGILASGALVLRYRRSLTLSALSILSALLIVPVFYVPWSVRWHWNKGYNAIRAEQYAKAVRHYTFVLERTPNDDGARNNMEIASRRLKAKAGRNNPQGGAE